MSIYCHIGIPDIRDILLTGNYDRFPSFIDIDKRLEWIERFAPYHDPRVYIRNHFDELAEIPTEIAKRLYRKIESTLQILHSHREVELLRIKEEFDELWKEYLERENETEGFRTLSDLWEEFQTEVEWCDEGVELTLCEQSYNLVIVPFQNELCIIKRTFLEIFRDDGDSVNKDYVTPIREFLLQEIHDIPIDLSLVQQTLGLSPEQLVSRIGSMYDTGGHKTLSSPQES